MRSSFIPALEACRLRSGAYGSDPGDTFGAFVIQGPCGMELSIIASDGIDAVCDGWEHVSVSGRRCPNWDEMCFVKNLFWREDEVVVQFHPKQADYINLHPHCLHMWARRDGTISTPPTILVGPRL